MTRTYIARNNHLLEQAHLRPFSLSLITALYDGHLAVAMTPKQGHGRHVQYTEGTTSTVGGHTNTTREGSNEQDKNFQLLLNLTDNKKAKNLENVSCFHVPVAKKKNSALKRDSTPTQPRKYAAHPKANASTSG